MAIDQEPEQKKFWRTIIIAMIFMVFMAILIIYRKNQKEKTLPKKEPTVQIIQ